MRTVEQVASYLPSTVVEFLLQTHAAESERAAAAAASAAAAGRRVGGGARAAAAAAAAAPLAPAGPQRQRLATVALFADVSGFTALAEALAAAHGPGAGGEALARHLNTYFAQMVRIIASMGGDIFKFAGDAVLVLWPDVSGMPLEERVQVRARAARSSLAFAACRRQCAAVPPFPRAAAPRRPTPPRPAPPPAPQRAGQCALEIQSNLHKAELHVGVTLSVKIGIGVGEVSVLHLGGVLRRMEYVAVGEPLVQVRRRRASRQCAPSAAPFALARAARGVDADASRPPSPAALLPRRRLRPSTAAKPAARSCSRPRRGRWRAARSAAWTRAASAAAAPCALRATAAASACGR
jgi:class 3 adenylate cyclase